MITLGGKAPGASIEVHDVQFIVAEHIEETYKTLKENWYGLDFKLHLDSYRVIKSITDYSIEIVDEVPTENSDLNLFFVNIGGYDESKMHELHSYRLVVAPDVNSAKKMALELYGDNMKEPHVDNISKVSNFKLLNKLYNGYIKLTPNKGEVDIKPEWFGYRRIDI